MIYPRKPKRRQDALPSTIRAFVPHRLTSVGSPTGAELPPTCRYDARRRRQQLRVKEPSVRPATSTRGLISTTFVVDGSGVRTQRRSESGSDPDQNSYAIEVKSNHW